MSLRDRIFSMVARARAGGEAEPPEASGDFDLIVHIGAGKTGSSSIQKTLKASEAVLRARGVGYLGLMGEHSPVRRYPWQLAGGWPEFARRPESAAELADMLDSAIAAFRRQGLTRAIWSNETIFGNHRLVLPILADLQARGVRVRLVMYVRRHDAWIRSAYLQWGIKHKTYPGPLKPFREWTKKNGVHFSSGVEPWLEKTWADLSVRNFDACGDVVQDFLGYYGLDFPGIARRRENETPNPTVLALWALYNAQSDDQVLPYQLQSVLRRTGVLEKGVVDVDFADLLPDDAELAEIWAERADDRERINRMFAACGQPPMDEAPLKSRRLEVTQAQINAALLLILKRQSDDIQRLKSLLQKQEDAGDEE